MSRPAFALAVLGLAALGSGLACEGARGDRELGSTGRDPATTEPTGPRPSPDPEPTPSPDQRKRECVERLTAGADPELHALLRSACAEWVGHDIPGLALAVVDADGLRFTAELGVRCFGGDDPVTPTTGFRIGSVSKPVTAALALTLVDAGTLALDAPASTIPSFTVPTGLPVPTLASLLTHRSGLAEIDPAVLVELDGAWLPSLARSHPAGPVGEFHYSNAGYSLVGAMLEAASATPYASLIAANIAQPLGLVRLFDDPRAPGLACGHLAEDPDTHPIAVADDLAFMPGDPRWMDPAGGLIASASDLARFALAIGTPALPGSAAMLEPGEALPGDAARSGHHDERYGLGLRSWEIDGRRVYGHTGNNVSFFTELVLVPGQRAIVVVANRGVELPATLAAAERLAIADE